jgi:hypothetical protein
MRDNITSGYIAPLLAIGALYKLRPTIKPNWFLWKMRAWIQKFIPKKLLKNKYFSHITGPLLGLATNYACRKLCFDEKNSPGLLKLHPSNILWNTVFALPSYYTLNWLMTYVEEINETQAK